MCHYGHFFDYAKIGLLILVFNLVGDVIRDRNSQIISFAVFPISVICFHFRYIDN